MALDQDIRPPGPVKAEGGPEKPVQPVQIGAPTFAFEHSELLSQGQNFRGGITPTAQKNQKGRHNCEDGLEHEPPFYHVDSRTSAQAMNHS